MRVFIPEIIEMIILYNLCFAMVTGVSQAFGCVRRSKRDYSKDLSSNMYNEGMIRPMECFKIIESSGKVCFDIGTISNIGWK